MEIISMPLPAILITIALFLYSAATWSERYAGILNRSHLSLFWAGLFFDAIGTGLMIHNSTIETFSLHSLSGYAGIFFMLIHTIWATVVLVKDNESMRIRFHRFSVGVWALWMFSYINGAMLGVSA